MRTVRHIQKIDPITCYKLASQGIQHFGVLETSLLIEKRGKMSIYDFGKWCKQEACKPEYRPWFEGYIVKHTPHGDEEFVPTMLLMRRVGLAWLEATFSGA